MLPDNIIEPDARRRAVITDKFAVIGSALFYVNILHINASHYIMLR